MKFMKKSLKILVAIFLSLMFTISLAKLVICIYDDYYFNEEENFTLFVEDVEQEEEANNQVDNWLTENDLGEYIKLFRDNGE
jgi:hypothetical protein